MASIAKKMCEIPKTPKIYDYNRDKMGIIQNKVVWNQNTGGGISLCSEFRNHSENFAMIAKFRYDSEKNVHSENFAGIAKFSLWLRNFHNPCEIFAMHSENPVIPALPPASNSASISSIPLDISSFWFDEITENSQHSAPIRHQT